MLNAGSTLPALHDVDAVDVRRSLQRWRSRGYSLPFVLLMLILLSISLASLLFVLLAGARSTESMLGRRRLFYACDGVSRVAAVSAQNYFGQTTTPTSQALLDFVCAQGGGCSAGNKLPTFLSQTPGHVLTEFEVSQVSTRSVGPMESGPFEGMNAMQDHVDMKVVVEKTSSGWKCDVTQQLSLAKISMFQFFVFSDQPYTEWVPGPIMSGDGRVHANGDLCLFSLTSVGTTSGGGGLWVSRVTASGRLSPGEGAPGRCRAKSFKDGPRGSVPRIAIVDNPVFDVNPGNTIPVEPKVSDFALFTTRSTTESQWLSDSLVFHGRLQDEAHHVVPLRLPVVGVAQVQRGANADAIDGAGDDNTSTRLLVDPLRIDGSDAADVSAQRFAFKADLRIIDGVWFLRDPEHPELVGTPIWSDHAGSVVTGAATAQTIPAGTPVGQHDIFGAAARPQRYSHYRFDDNRKLVTSSITPSAVVSYGVLARDGVGPPVWRPGYYCGSAVQAVGSTCASVPTPQQQLLAGVRAGFRDGHAQKQFGTSSSRANILPMNIDVAALQNALADCSTSELGSFFPGTCSGSPVVEGVSGPRRFNGVVYITNTWPGSAAPTPGSVPAQGARGGAGPNSGKEQKALPQALCSSDNTAIATLTSSTGVNFTACADHEGLTIPDTASVTGARATAVRIINSRNLNGDAAGAAGRPALTRAGTLANGVEQTGLTIATNLPVYVLGDANASSVPGSAPWVPFLIAGDVVTLLSNAWNDEQVSWNSALSTARIGDTTTMNIEILAGWTPTTATAYSGGLHNFPRFLEDWQSRPLNIKGSLVVGWSAVYARWPASCCDAVTYRPPTRAWGFDTNLNSIMNQPPGAPLFDVQATLRWKR